MLCKYPMQQKHKLREVWYSVPCGRCLPCRINKRSSWVLRNRLEALTAATSSFWTLTAAEDYLECFHESRWRRTVYRFFEELRREEIRQGNHHPIRYFGCLEYGGSYGRPHIHVLIYNLVATYIEPTTYTKGFPRPRHHIKQWPHGHVDVGTFNTASVHYVVDYLTNFWEAAGQKSYSITTRRPAIGFYGLDLLVEKLMKKATALPAVPGTLMFGEKWFPFDQWTRDQFEKLWIKKGGTFTEKFSLRNHVAELKEFEALQNALPEFFTEQQEKRLARYEKGYEEKKAEKARFEAAVTQNALTVARAGRQRKGKESPKDVKSSQHPSASDGHKKTGP